MFSFPREWAARIALDTVVREAPSQPSLARVVFCCFNESDAAIYRGLMQALPSCQG